MRRVALFMASAILAAAPGAAKDKEPRTWKATRTVDPITDARSCVVSALDYVGSQRYARTGYLYPIIEMNSQFGLLIGVSSGGRYRLPSGPILWRVDDKPFRELKPEDNPPSVQSALPKGVVVATQTIAETTALTNKLVLAATATSTLASGETARAMLAELRAGKGLIFRASVLSAPYGLPDPSMAKVGQTTKDGLKPVPVDASLEAALAECGIVSSEGLR